MKDKTTLKYGPDFIGVGAQRSGTSWLYNCLIEHPNIFMPQKEVHYFDKHCETKSIHWYDELFHQEGDKKVTGEFTPDYMFHQQTISEIHNHYPDAKLIIILRNPIERSYSAYNLFKSHGRFKDMNFEEALTAEPFLLEQSLYSEQIKNIYKYFKKEQVFIGFYEDISNQPLKLYQSVCDFLNVENNILPNSLKVVKNSSALSSAQNKFNIPKLQKRIENSILKKPFNYFKSTQIANIIKRKLITNKNTNKNIIIDKAKEELVLSDIKTLEKLLNISLTHWR